MLWLVREPLGKTSGFFICISYKYWKDIRILILNLILKTSHMSRFEINFTFDSINYKAKVIRIGSGTVQYNIQEITPKTFEFPDAIMLIWNYDEHKLEWGCISYTTSSIQLYCLWCNHWKIKWIRDFYRKILNKLINLVILWLEKG